MRHADQARDHDHHSVWNGCIHTIWPRLMCTSITCSSALCGACTGLPQTGGLGTGACAQPQWNNAVVRLFLVKIQASMLTMLSCLCALACWHALQQGATRHHAIWMSVLMGGLCLVRAGPSGRQRRQRTTSRVWSAFWTTPGSHQNRHAWLKVPSACMTTTQSA